MSSEAFHNAPRSPVKVTRVKWLLPLMAAQTAAIAFVACSVTQIGAKTDRLARTVALDGALPAEAPVGAAADAASLTDIRTIVREEVARLGAQPLERPQEAPTTAAPASPAATAAARDKVRRELEAHIARGRMSNLEIERFLTEAAELPPAEREQMMRKFLAAINSGKLDARF